MLNTLLVNSFQWDRFLSSGNGRLYKYSPFNLNTLDSLINQYFYLPQKNQLNDPIEMPAISGIGPDHLIDSDYRICSFSKNQNSMLMWSHYTENHQGIMVEYQFCSGIPNGFGIGRIKYTNGEKRKMDQDKYIFNQYLLTVGGAVGNATLALSAASFGARAGLSVIIGTTATGTTAAAIGSVLNVIGFILLVVGVGITWIYSKSYIENLLFRCFWGKSDIYSFWYFENEGNIISKQRLILAKQISERLDLQTAYDIEIQEFINLLMQPSVTVSKESNLFSNRVNTTYEFVLPNFIWEVSEIVGSIQKQTIDIAQPIQHIKQVSSLDESGTQAFTTSLQSALEDPAKHELKEGALHLKVNVELDNGSTLHWYYKPKKDLIVPKRMLTQAGVLKQVYIGMKDDALI